MGQMRVRRTGPWVKISCPFSWVQFNLSEGDFARSDGDAILSVGEAEYAAASDAAGTPILLDESTDPYLLHLIGLSAGDWVHALSAEAPDLKDGVYTVSVIIERVRPLDFVLN